MRLHPVHFRLLEDSSQFQRYSWIRMRVKKATQDPRPESYHLDESKIEIIKHTATDNQGFTPPFFLAHLDGESLYLAGEISGSETFSALRI